MSLLGLEKRLMFPISETKLTAVIGPTPGIVRKSFCSFGQYPRSSYTLKLPYSIKSDIIRISLPLILVH